MREKYINERFPSYFEFGVHSDGRVDLATCENDTVVTCSKEHAKVLMEDQQRMYDMLVNLAIKLDEVAPEVFREVWYNESDS